jgi:hypothetical protein
VAPPPFSGRHGRRIIWISLVEVSEKKGEGKASWKELGRGSMPGVAVPHHCWPAPVTGAPSAAASYAVRKTRGSRKK